MEEPSDAQTDQHLDVKFNSKLEENLYRELYAKLKNDFEMKIQKPKTGEEVDRMKFQRLIAEYKKFKRNHVQHFRFNSSSNHSAFGKFKTLSFARLQCFRGRDSVNSSARADLL